jgi:mannosyltransferase OCH1-like enzyme
MIPKIIHQIWVGDSEIPKFCLDYSKELQEMYPDYEFKIWRDEDLKEFPSCKFLEVCNENKYWGYSVDWYRALILNKYGGLYLDFDVKYISRIPDSLLEAKYILPLEYIECVSNYIVGMLKNTRFTQNLIDYYLSYSDEEFDKVKWSAPEVYKYCLEKTFGRYSIYDIEHGFFSSKFVDLVFIDMEYTKKYFDHIVGTIEKHFKDEQS